MTDFFTAALLGVVEGLTEFLPVSSTGHLIVVGDILGFKGPPGRTFEVMIQLGAILALCVYYMRRLLGYVFTLHTSPASRSVIGAMLVGMIPAVVLGLLFHKHIKEVLYSPKVVAIALIVGGIIMLVVERWQKYPHVNSVEKITLKSAFLIGVAQAVALIPGVSRSGATIVGGLLCKLDKRTAAEFSFLLSIPIMSAAFVYDAYKNWSTLDWSNASLIATGFVTAFISALLIVKPFLDFISRAGFTPFAIYRIVLGVGLLVLLK